MMIGVLTIDIAILDARSLKEKRGVIKSVKAKLRNRFNVSVAEVAYHDVHKRCQLALAMVSTDARPLHSQLDKIVELIRRVRGLTLLDYERSVI